MLMLHVSLVLGLIFEIIAESAIIEVYNACDKTLDCIVTMQKAIR